MYNTRLLEIAKTKNITVAEIVLFYKAIELENDGYNGLETIKVLLEDKEPLLRILFLEYDKLSEKWVMKIPLLQGNVLEELISKLPAKSEHGCIILPSSKNGLENKEKASVVVQNLDLDKVLQVVTNYYEDKFCTTLYNYLVSDGFKASYRDLKVDKTEKEWFS